MNSIFKSEYKYIFLSSLVVFLITAYFSEGYNHPDEHFQILEFCNYKLGNSPAADLTWEYHHRIRPSLQPTIAWLFIKCFNFFGIYNPFFYAFFFRILTAFLSWFIISKTTLLFIKDFKSDVGKKLFLYLSLLLWFIPFVSVRFSSENYSAMTFMGAVLILLQTGEQGIQKKWIQLAFAGILLCLSFFFRFQIAFAGIGLALWLIFIKKEIWKTYLILIVSGLCTMVICIYLDYWFYGKFELTPVNYFISNIVDDVASEFGTSPWWSYFTYFIVQVIPPLSIILLISFFAGLYYKPKSIFTWILIPFLLAHFAVAHKEMRFMLPILFGFTYLAAIGIDRYIDSGKFRRAGKLLLILSLIVNIPLLIYRLFIPGQEAIKYYHFLYTASAKNEITIICPDINIYEFNCTIVNFYKSPRVHPVVLNDNFEIKNYLDTYQPDSIYILDRTLSSSQSFSGYTSESLYCLFPDWLLRNNTNNWQGRTKTWNIKLLRKKVD